VAIDLSAIDSSAIGEGDGEGQMNSGGFRFSCWSNAVDPFVSNIGSVSTWAGFTNYHFIRSLSLPHDDAIAILASAVLAC
jgi:hypothetical protein